MTETTPSSTVNALTASAISFGQLTLICRVARMGLRGGQSHALPMLLVPITAL